MQIAYSKAELDKIDWRFRFVQVSFYFLFWTYYNFADDILFSLWLRTNKHLLLDNREKVHVHQLAARQITLTHNNKKKRK